MRYFNSLAAIGLVLSLASCGGGGGGDGGSANNRSPNPVIAANAVTVRIEPGPASNVNLIFATVTVCSPGSANCQTIDNVLVDTGSNGLRLFSSVLSPALALPQQAASSGGALAQCAHFADGVTWGPVKTADVKMASQTASSVPIQIITEPGFAPIPTSCSNKGVDLNTVRSFGANGVLGVGLFVEDCGAPCATNPNYAVYFGCTGSTCSLSTASLAQQVRNPVANFANDNNGVVISLPAVPPGGASTVEGSMTFGIGTQSNNVLGSARVFQADPNTGYITTVYKGRTLPNSFIDSGSNGIFFRDPTIPVCESGFFCPSATLSLSATLRGRGVSPTEANVTFNVANAERLFSDNPNGSAFANLAGDFPEDTSFDWGLPFFYGRSVFTAIDGRSTPGGTGPYFAF